MKKLNVMFALLYSLFFILPAQAFTGVSEDGKAFVGNWEGKLNVGPTSLRLVLHVKPAEGGKYSGTLDSPDQGAFGIPVDNLTIANKEIEVKIAAIGVTYKAKLDDAGAAISGTFSQGGMNIPLELKKTEKVAEPPKRPQVPAKPYPYNETEVKFKNEKAGVTLAGTFTSPKEGSSFPAVVLVTGSGKQNRNEELLGHKPFLILADYLTRNGIAVLRYDDRGYGESTGNFDAALTSDFAEDALAAVEYLKTRKDVDAKKIGIIGHSEGGMVAPMAAKQSKDIAFIIMMAGPGIPGNELLVEQIYLIEKANGMPEDYLANEKKFNAKIFSYIKTVEDTAKGRAELSKMVEEYIASLPDSMRNSPEASPEKIKQQLDMCLTPWFRNFMAYDPGPALEQVKCPVLAINGDLDLQVPSKLNLPEIEKRLKNGGNKNFKVVELKGLNHLFQNAKTGSPAEYMEIEETMSPVALDMMLGFVKSIK